MNELKVICEQTILGENFKVYGTIDEPLFLAKDVAEWIDYSETNVKKMMEMVDDDEKIKMFCTINTIRHNDTKPVNISVSGGANRWFLTEDGLYEVLMQSRKPLAKMFKAKVKNLLKELRKNNVNNILDANLFANAIVSVINPQLEKLHNRITETNDNVNRLENQFDSVKDLINIRTSHKSNLTRSLKNKLSNMLGYNVTGNDTPYRHAKNQIFKDFSVDKW